MVRAKDLEEALTRAEKALHRTCLHLSRLFDPELVRGSRLEVRIDTARLSGSRLEEMGPPVVRIPAPVLGASREEVLVALLHAMVHWVNAQRGVADCNHAGYHNRHFRDLARTAGFTVGDRHPRTGWTDLSPTPDLRARLAPIPLHSAPLHRLLEALPTDPSDAPGRCKPNLPIGEAASPYWRAAETLLPKVPRYHLELHRQTSHAEETYPKIRTTADAV